MPRKSLRWLASPRFFSPWGLYGTVGAMALAAVLSFVVLQSVREPRFQGRSVTSWLEEINKAGSLSNTAPAMVAIRSMGTNALPHLLENVRQRTPSPLKLKLIALAEKSELPARNLNFIYLRYSPTCLALRELGTNAASIVPDLQKLLLDPKHTASASFALYSIGHAAGPAFEEGCASPHLNIRVKSALYLAETRIESARCWATDWSTSPQGRQQFSLSTMTCYMALQRVAQRLTHPNPAVRRASAEALMIESDGKYFLRELKAAANDPDEQVRLAAQKVVRVLEGEFAVVKIRSDRP